MRVQLPSPTTPAPTDSNSQPAAPPREPRVWTRVAAQVAHWSIAVPILALCGAALCWSLFFRLANSQRLLKVHARAAQPAGNTNRPVTLEELWSLREQVREHSACLILQRKDIPPMLARLDGKARELGWRCDASLKPAVAAPGGVRELTLHPVVIDLRYEYVQPERAYSGLLALLWTVSTLSQRAEVAAVRLHSLGRGLNSAQVELNFYCLNPHEENTPK